MEENLSYGFKQQKQYLFEKQLEISHTTEHVTKLEQWDLYKRSLRKRKLDVSLVENLLIFIPQKTKSNISFAEKFWENKWV